MLSELGAFIWDLLPEVETEEEICSAILEQYDADAETVRADVSEFMNKLREMDII